MIFTKNIFSLIILPLYILSAIPYFLLLSNTHEYLNNIIYIIAGGIMLCCGILFLIRVKTISKAFAVHFDLVERRISIFNLFMVLPGIYFALNKVEQFSANPSIQLYLFTMTFSFFLMIKIKFGRILENN